MQRALGRASQDRLEATENELASASAALSRLRTALHEAKDLPPPPPVAELREHVTRLRVQCYAARSDVHARVDAASRWLEGEAGRAIMDAVRQAAGALSAAEGELAQLRS